MRTLAQETGAQAFFPMQIFELKGVYASIAQELSSQYSIGVLAGERPGRRPVPPDRGAGGDASRAQAADPHRLHRRGGPRHAGRLRAGRAEPPRRAMERRVALFLTSAAVLWTAAIFFAPLAHAHTEPG